MNSSAFIAAFFITFVAFSVQEILKPSVFEKAFVTKVIDGDSFHIENSVVVRLIGANSPEKGQPLYENATILLKKLIEGKNITMEKDVMERDNYGRLLRYIFIGNIFIEEEMVKNGFANIYIIPPNEKYASQIKKAEQYARENKLGLWKADEEYAGCILVSEFHWNAAGNDMENLNGEYVSFRNNCNITINMNGWTLKDSGTKVYKFGRGFLGPEGSVKISSGCGNNTDKDLFWCSKRSVWNNNGDALYLRNSQGFLVLTESYEGNY